MRIGTQLVAVRADTEPTLARLRALFATWIDDTNPDVPWAFSVQVDDNHQAGVHVGPRPVPQLHLGGRLFARSRSGDEIFVALASVLGGVLASQDKTRCWLALRAFARGNEAALADVQPAVMSADRSFARNGIVELPTWVVAVEPSSNGTTPATIEVPSVLSGLDWAGAELTPPDKRNPSYPLVGIVGIDPKLEPADPRDGFVARPGRLLARFGARHSSAGWFTTVRQLVEAGHAASAPDRRAARNHILAWLDSTT